MEKQAEKELILNIQDDPDQFGILFDAWYPKIFNYVFRRTGDYAAAKDICSETFLKAFLNIRKFQWRSIPISFWLYRIAGNEIMQYFRKEKYTPDSLDLMIELSGWDMIDPETSLENELQLEKEQQNNKDFIVIQQRLKNLPGIYQEAIALRYFEQKSIKEIALILAKKEGTIKSLLSRGAEKLRNI